MQLFGSVPEEMRDAAVLLEALGFASVDINMGCPVRKVTRIGGGSAMMTELKKTAGLVRGMVEAVKIPVTAKMRLGWDSENLTAPDLARVLEDAGVAAVFVHGRTRAQGFGGTVNLAGIRAVVEAVRRIPVIGNGDVTTPEAAKKMLAETGCAGVSIGRGRVLQSVDLPADPALPAHRRAAARTVVRRARARDVPSSRPDDRGLRRGARLPDVPQGRGVVCEALGPGDGVPAPARHIAHARRIPRGAGRLPGVARAVLRRTAANCCRNTARRSWSPPSCATAARRIPPMPSPCPMARSSVW